MLPFAAIVAIISALIWLYLLCARGSFWRVKPQVGRVDPTAQSPERIAVLVPARNEADVVGESITSLLNQTCSPLLHILLIDDNSTDGTAQRARDAAEGAGKSDLLTVLHGRPLAPGWTGKLWALQQGLEQALCTNPDWILLTDADILHAPDNISTLTSIATRGGYDFASFMVKLRYETIAEKLLIPAFVYFFLKLYPPAWIADPRHSTAGAAGGCILVRPQALMRAGGVEAIRDQIIDDCALARAVKHNGGRVWLGLTSSTSSVRSYASFAEIGRMISRNAFNQLHHSSLMLIAAVIGMALTYVVPALSLASQSPIAVATGAAAFAMMTISYLPMISFYRLNKLWSLTLPLAAIFFLGATIHSALTFWSGRGGQWKGRAQDVSGSSALER